MAIATQLTYAVSCHGAIDSVYSNNKYTFLTLYRFSLIITVPNNHLPMRPMRRVNKINHRMPLDTHLIRILIQTLEVNWECFCKVPLQPVTWKFISRKQLGFLLVFHTSRTVYTQLNPFTLREAKKGLTVLDIFFEQKHFL